jgi:Rrf2 family iron-sulfur cluster assembly transcriptional regulator
VKPNKKIELALNGMVELARRSPSRPMSLAILAEKQAISLSYLEQVFAALRKSGLVLSVRGPGGGYLLAREAWRISTGDIIDALDNGPNSSPGDGSMVQREIDAVITFWDMMDAQVSDLFSKVSLQDVIDGTLRNVGVELETTTQIVA